MIVDDPAAARHGGRAWSPEPRAGTPARPRPRLVFLGKVLLACVGGSLLGLGLTCLAIQRGTGFGEVGAGPWKAYPSTGTTESDPYLRAMLAISGELPLGTAEGLSFTARTDSSGAPLHARCDYIVSGRTPRARYWTLALQSPDGRLVANAAERYGFTSAEILRSADGSFEVAVSREVRPGNWLPIGDDAAFVLVLRLYDTEIDTRAAPLEASRWPQIVAGRCR